MLNGQNSLSVTKAFCRQCSEGHSLKFHSFKFHRFKFSVLSFTVHSFPETLIYWVGVPRGQSYLMGRRCLFSLGWQSF